MRKKFEEVDPLAFLEKLFGSFSKKELKKIQPIADKVLALEDEFAAKTDSELRAMTPALRARPRTASRRKTTTR